MTLHLHRSQLLVCFLVWEALFFLLSAFQYNPFGTLNLIGFLTLAFIPGLLAILILKLDGLSFWIYVGLAISFSLFVLTAGGLLSNTLLPHMGIARPLDKPFLLAGFFLVLNALIFAVWKMNGEVRITLKKYLIFENIRDTILALTPAFFVLMSIAGAIRLNNGATGLVTLLMLIGMVVYISVLIYYAEEVGEEVIPTAVFFIGLSLLLMTSLRGWHITGHDIQREYGVFQLTKENGVWSMGQYRDAYNACMSITILPTIFSKLLKISDPYIYKVLFQILFATVPVTLFLLLRRYVSATVAFLSVLYFLAFPTFFSDMPFLLRQEIASVFLMLMMYLIFDDTTSLFKRRCLFVFFGLGMVLSHYSTTYTVIGILIVDVCMQPFVRLMTPYIRKIPLFTQSSLEALSNKDFIFKPLITFWMLILLVSATFLWTGVVTDTASGSITNVVKKTLAAIGSNAKEDVRSSDVSAGLFSYSKINYDALFQSYKKKVVEPARTGAGQGAYFDVATYARYPIQVAPDDVVPLTYLGKTLAHVGIDVSKANYIFRQVAAKLLQLLIGIGFVFAFFSKRFVKRYLDTEFVLFALGSLMFLVAIAVLPVLSVEYGLLRAFQQSLIFLCVFLVVGSLALVVKLSKKKQILFVSILALTFFMSETGVLTQLFGGYNPSLHLNNDGLYYDSYVLHKTEITAMDWFTSVVKNTSRVDYQVQADKYIFSKFLLQKDVNISVDVYPELVRQNSYVFLGYTNVHKQRVTLSYSGTLITYLYPMQFLDDNKNLIYNNGDVRIYK